MNAIALAPQADGPPRPAEPAKPPRPAPMLSFIRRPLVDRSNQPDLASGYSDAAA